MFKTLCLYPKSEFDNYIERLENPRRVAVLLAVVGVMLFCIAFVGLFFRIT